MRDYAKEAVALAKVRSRAEFGRNRVLNLALVRLCELIGEAATKVPTEIRQKNPRIPWRSLVAFRNRVIHDYDSVDLDVVWQILTGDLPALIVELDQLLNDP